MKKKLDFRNLPEMRIPLNEDFPIQYSKEDVKSIDDLNVIMNTRQVAGILLQTVVNQITSRDTLGFKKGELKPLEVSSFNVKTEDGSIWSQSVSFELPEYGAKITILAPEWSGQRESPNGTRYFMEKSCNVYADKALPAEVVDRVVGTLAQAYSQGVGKSDSADYNDVVPVLLEPKLTELVGGYDRWNQTGKNLVIEKRVLGYNNLPEEMKDPEWKQLSDVGLI